MLEGDATLASVSDAPGLPDLHDDAANWYPSALRLGAATQHLDELIAAGLPKDAAAASASFERLKALSALAPDVALVHERATPLLRLAKHVCEMLADPQRCMPVRAGQFTVLDADRARIAYTFDDPKEFADWVRQDDYPGEWFQRTWKIRTLPKNARLELRNGALRGVGAVGCRLPVAFKPPLVARYHFMLSETIADDSIPAAIGIAVCDDGKGSRVVAESLGTLWANDPRTKEQTREDAPDARYELDHEYALELRVANGSASTFVDGKQIGTLAVGEGYSGETLFLLRTDWEFALTSFELEGVFDREQQRKCWVAAQVRALRF